MSEIPSSLKTPPCTWKIRFKIFFHQREYFPNYSGDTIFHLDFISVNYIASHKMD